MADCFLGNEGGLPLCDFSWAFQCCRKSEHQRMATFESTAGSCFGCIAKPANTAGLDALP